MRSRFGFSLVMVMVGAALLGLLGIAFSEMIGGALKGQKTVQNAVDFDILKTSISMVLNTKACDGAFKNTAGNPVQINFSAPLVLGANVIPASTPVSIQKILQGNTVIAEQGASLGGGMSVSKLEFADAIYDGDHVLGTPPVTYRAFVATLKVEAQRPANSMGKQSPEQTFSVRLLLQPNAANTVGDVVRCSPIGIPPNHGAITFLNPGASTWTVPGDVRTVKLRVWGAGGGGGAGIGGNTGGAGGGGGAYVEGIYDVVGGQVLNIQVGRGGISGTSGSNGQNGSASSVTIAGTVLASAGGGTGGSGWSTGNVTGAAGGVPSGGNILNVAGHVGQSAIIYHLDGKYRSGVPGGCYGVTNGMPYGGMVVSTPQPNGYRCQGGYGSSFDSTAFLNGGDGRVIVEW